MANVDTIATRNSLFQRKARAMDLRTAAILAASLHQ